MCKIVIETIPWLLQYVLDECKTQEMCDEAVRILLYLLKFVPGKLELVLDHFKTREICDCAVRGDLYSLQYVIDCILYGFCIGFKSGMLAMIVAMMINFLYVAIAIQGPESKRKKS